MITWLSLTWPAFAPAGRLMLTASCLNRWTIVCRICVAVMLGWIW